MQSIGALARVISWCRRRHIEVVFVRTECASYVPGRIEVNGRLAPQRQLHLLLHECGHFLTGDRFKVRGRVLPIDRRFGIMFDEYESWQQARKLAGRLKLSLENFDSTRTEMLHAYTQWLARPRDFID